MSATEARRRFSSLLDAAQREPVLIQRHNRDVAVVLSSEDFEHLRSLRVREFEDFCHRVSQTAAERGLTEQKLQELLG